MAAAALRGLPTSESRETGSSRNDTGARLSLLCNADSTQLLAHWVRDRQTLSLERAIHLLTGRQAEIFQLRDRRCCTSVPPRTSRCSTPIESLRSGPELVRDVPGGGTRIAQRAIGIERVIVSGRTLLRGGQSTRERLGRILRPAEMAAHS